MTIDTPQAIKQAVEQAQRIVVVQADNPDGDSLSSALALESILGELGKDVSLYCGVAIPTYLRHLEGWDRVQAELPHSFDLSIIVDTSARSLLEQLDNSGEIKWLAAKPSIIIDHHTASQPTIDFANIVHIVPGVSATEVIYELSQALSWQRDHIANYMIAAGILSDSLGLTSEGTSPRSIHIIAELVEQGVSIPELENARRSTQKKSQAILEYKGRLLQRIEYAAGQRIALVTIPWEEIELYSNEYNPSMLVIDEMRMVEDVALGIAFKTYPDGRITGKIRANYGFAIAAELAGHFGGGGHPYAAGFRVTDGRSIGEVKSECIARATQLLDTLKQGTSNETIQHQHAID